MSSGVTLVAFYRSKPERLATLIETCQRLLKRRWGDAYLPYGLDQIHTTLVGLEGYRTNSIIQRSSPAPTIHVGTEIELSRAIAYLKGTPLLPLRARIGGFQENIHYGFTSQGETPYVRSFSLRDNAAIIIGWPVNDDSFPNTLFALRKSLEQFGILHKYHENGAIDNDIYFVLGNLPNSGIPIDVIKLAIHQVRRYLSRYPITIELSVNDLWVVKYDSPTLLPESSLSWRVTEMALDQRFLLSLYEETPVTAS